MSALASCDVGSVEQAASVLAQCAELTADGSAACTRAVAATWRWRGPAARSFDSALHGLRRQLSEVESAHREAAEAVTAYASGLADAAVLARRAEAMDREADALGAAFRRAAMAATTPLCGPDPGESMRAAAARLRREAADQEEIAASWAAAKLEGLAARAPQAPRFAGGSRFLDDFAAAVGSSFVGLAQLGLLAGRSLGFGDHEGEARHELWAAAKDSVKVWQPVQDIWDDLTGGRPGSAFGAAVGLGLTRKMRAAEKTRLRDPGLAHREALREAWRRELLAAHGPITRQTAREMGMRGVSLVNEEARGGHVLERHVAASRGYLRRRNARGIEKAGTFPDLATAERLINVVLREHTQQLREMYRLTPGKSLRLSSEFDFVTGRVTVPGSGKSLAARSVTVVLRLEGGEPHVYTAFPEL
jgi:hypothetical protein